MSDQEEFEEWTDIVGRDNELNQVDEILKKYQPALVVVVGEERMGKSTFLQAIAHRAEKQGWKALLLSGSEGSAYITPDMSIEALQNKIREAINKLNSNQEIDAKESKEQDWRGLLGSTPIGKPRTTSDTNTVVCQIQDHTVLTALVPDQETPIEANLEVSVSDQQETVGISPDFINQTSVLNLAFDQPQPYQSSFEESQFIRTPNQSSLAENPTYPSPLVLLIDGYQSSEKFTEQFIDQFLENIRKIRQPLIAFVAGYPSNVKVLSIKADNVIVLGSLDSMVVRNYFERISQEIVPPLDRKELDIYTKNACLEPKIIHILTNVLELAKPL